MKSLLARISGLAATTLLLLAGSVGLTQPAQAQSEQVNDQQIAMNYSLYYENFKNNSFAAALPELKWVIENAPQYPSNDDRNFERLINTYVGLAGASEDAAEKQAYLDSALAWFDRSVDLMKEHEIQFNEVQWQLREGRFVQEHAAELGDRAPDLASLYLEAFEMGGCDIDPYYVRLITDDYARRGEKQAAVDMTDRAEECYPDNADVAAYVAQVRNNLFTSPDERMTFLESRLEEDPENVEIASELFDIYLVLEYRQEAAEMGARLLELEESASTLRRLGELHLADGNTEEAIAYYEQALALPGATETQRRNILFNLGIAKQQDGALAQARTYFRRALEIDGSYGQAYLAIGDLYVTAVSACGSFEREDQAVYWLAVDYYQRARANDASVAAQADQKIATYRRSFPNQEALFFKNWEPGQAYRINYGCYSWINESTTVKQPG